MVQTWKVNMPIDNVATMIGMDGRQDTLLLLDPAVSTVQAWLLLWRCDLLYEAR